MGSKKERPERSSPRYPCLQDMLSAESCRKVEEDNYGTEEGNEQGKVDEEGGEKERGGRKRDAKKNKDMAERG